MKFERPQGWGLPVVAWPDRLRPTVWDLAAFPLVFGALALLAWGAESMTVPYQVGEPLTISLDPANLPVYALRTVLRMFLALGVALVFSLAYAALAAKNRHAEKLLIPLLDILQSVPILGFLSITVAGFIALFPGRLLGVECAAIFAIFTSQAWNMTFSLYQSFRTVPGELIEAARMFHLGRWTTFWRLEVPHAMPGLVWNMMMSVSGGWFFVVASEAITVHGQTIALPGIGSYIATAIDQRSLPAIGYAVLTMLVVILIYDQVLFRPLLAWSRKFRNEQHTGDAEAERPWFLILTQKARLFELFRWLGRRARAELARRAPKRRRRLAAAPSAGARGGRTATAPGRVDRVVDAAIAVATAVRVVVLIVLASVLWVPVGVWIGLRPDLARRAQPVVQFLAAFPANLFYPVAIALILRLQLNVEIWISPLMILGTQWYILFNVIAGASAIPSDLHYAAGNLGVSRWLWWRRIILPAIFPAYITGAVTAAGGSWNASIVSEAARWGDTTLTATGIGAYIAQVTDSGDFPRVVLGIGALCLYVVLFNRLFWRRLYDVAAERLRLD
jgi:NitT/TauT family transport system permease protein